MADVRVDVPAQNASGRRDTRRAAAFSAPYTTSTSAAHGMQGHSGSYGAEGSARNDPEVLSSRASAADPAHYAQGAPGTRPQALTRPASELTVTDNTTTTTTTTTSPRRRLGLHTASTLVGAGIMTLTRTRTPQREPHWSLFEQRMENEGQMRGGTLQRAGRASVVQSPASDAQTASDYFATQSKAGSGDGDLTPLAHPAATVSEAAASAPAEATGRRWYTPRYLLPTLSPLQRNVLKCSIAYFIGSLFTFAPVLSSWIAAMTSDGPAEKFPAPFGHMVATVAVYFNPAKTLGAMVEADKFCLMGLLFASFVSLGSMAMFWALEVHHGWEWLAEFLVLLWVGVAISIVAWMKLWMAKPSFNPACSMTVIILFVVIVREGGLEQLVQVAFIVLVGSVVSNVVCYTVWPQSATRNLQGSMTKTLDSFSTLLQMLTSTFLLEEPLHPLSHEKLQKAVENHQASFTSLKKNLGEAGLEWFIGGPSGKGRTSSGRAYEDAIDSLTRLAQHLNGLRSGTGLQYELAKAHSEGRVVLRSLSMMSSEHSAMGNGRPDSGVNNGKDASRGTSNFRDSQESDYVLQAAAAMFGDLMDDLGPPLKALSNTCTTALERCRETFLQASDKEGNQLQNFLELAEGIERALFNFESTSNHAVMRMYRRSDVSARSSTLSLSSYGTDENQLLSADNHENVFLVYFFIFTLEEFARELISLVDAMSRIYTIEREKSFRRYWNKLLAILNIRDLFHAVLPKPSVRRRQRPTLRRLSSYVTAERRSPLVSFPKVRPHAPNTVQTPGWQQLSLTGKLDRALWTIGARLKERDTKYAIKSGMAMVILASPAFFESTRPVFMEFRGEWALISFFVVMSPTIGATNFLSVHRVLGTLFGAAIATCIYTLFPDNPLVLSIFGFFYSLPCFYYIVARPEYATSARFVLLTYNLTCLYRYNLRQRTDISILDIAFHRSVAVTVGVVWAAIVSRFWWPAEARRELSKALSEFCLDLGWLYTRLVASNSFAPELQDSSTDRDESDTPPEEVNLTERRARGRTKLSNSIQEFMAMELHLQRKLIEIQGLLSQTQHEPRLKGPFPVTLYRSILTSLQVILDKLHSMRCVTTREEWYTNVRRDFIIPVNKERHDMVGNIILYFSTLASAFRLKAPLPPYLPPVEKARQNLVDAIRKLDVVKNRDVKGSRQLLFFAYALTMQGVTQELEKLGYILQEAFGVIGRDAGDFEALFGDQGTRISHAV